MTRWTACTALAGLVGCAPTYAPPIRAPHAGAPARAREGDVVLGGAAAGIIPGGIPQYGGPSLSYGVRDWVAVEGGADFGANDWTMGWAGARFTHAPRRHARIHYAGDLETALGAGWGGRCRDVDRCDHRPPSARRAGGALLGAGVSGHFAFFSLYGRGRLQATRADGIPPTLWGTIGPGLQFRIGDTVDLFSQVSFAGYTNRLDATYGFVYEIGVAVRIPTPR